MATLADLNVRLSADSKQMMTELDKAARQFRRKSREMSELANNMFVSVTVPLVGLGATAIQSAAEIEKLTNAMTSTMGSAEAAAAELELLREAARAPGLDFEQAVKGSVRLQAVGISAEDSRRALSAFGNALALAGGSSADLDGVALALGQIAAKGKVSAEEINQLAERVPQIRAAMKDAFGTADTEQLQKLGITSEKFISEIIKSFEKLPKATGGLTESLTNFSSSIKLAFASLGQSISTAIDLEGKLNALADAVAGLADWFKSLSPETQKFIVYTGLAAAAIGPLAKAFAAYNSLALLTTGTIRNLILVKNKLILKIAESSKAFLAANAAIQNATAIGIMIGVVVALAAAWYNYTSGLTNAEKATKALNDVQITAKQSIVEEEMRLDALIAKIKDENTARGEKQKAIKELQALSPEIFGNLTKEKELESQLVEGKKKYIEVVLKQAEADAIYNELVKKRQEALSISVKSEEAQLSTFQQLIKYGKQITNPIAAFNYEQVAIAQNAKDAKGAIEEQIGALEQRLKVLKEGGAAPGLNAGAGGGGGDTKGGAEAKAAKTTADVMAELAKNYENAAIKARLYGEEAGLNAERSSLLKGAISDLLELGVKPTDAAIVDLTNNLKDLKLEKLVEDYEQIAIKAETFGDVSTVNAERAAFLKTAINDLLENGFSPTDAAVTGLLERLNGLNESLALLPEITTPAIEVLAQLGEKTKTFGDYFGSIGDTLTSAATAAGKSMMEMAASGETSFKKLGKAALGAAAKVIRGYIMEGVAAVVSDALKKFGLIGLAIGAAAGAGAGVLFNQVLKAVKVPALAKGGLAYGPQLAMVGDNPNATTDPEVIAPLSKLQNIMGRKQEITGVVRVSGSDLLIMLENAERNQRRYGT